MYFLRNCRGGARSPYAHDEVHTVAVEATAEAAAPAAALAAAPAADPWIHIFYYELYLSF